MTPREKFIKCLKREPITGHVPHFELVFFLTMEAIGKIHPQHRCFDQWDQMSRREQDLHVKDIAETYIQTAEKYDHSAIFVQMDTSNMKYFDRIVRILEEIRNQSGSVCRIYYTLSEGYSGYLQRHGILYHQTYRWKYYADSGSDGGVRTGCPSFHRPAGRCEPEKSKGTGRRQSCFVRKCKLRLSSDRNPGRMRGGYPQILTRRNAGIWIYFLHIELRLYRTFSGTLRTDASHLERRGNLPGRSEINSETDKACLCLKKGK